MHRFGLALGVCAILTLSACTSASPPVSPSPVPSVSSTGATPAASSSASTSTTTPAPAPTKTVSTKPSPTPSASTFNPALSLLVKLTYRSGERATSARFYVPVSGYTVSYTCDELPKLTSDSSYVITSPNGQRLATRQLVCDGMTHSKIVPAAEVARAGTAEKMLTIALPGDLEGITRVDIEVRGDAA
jgi:hypothetical protein